jgi:hypothetical protein
MIILGMTKQEDEMDRGAIRLSFYCLLFFIFFIFIFNLFVLFFVYFSVCLFFFVYAFYFIVCFLHSASCFGANGVGPTITTKRQSRAAS